MDQETYKRIGRKGTNVMTHELSNANFNIKKDDYVLAVAATFEREFLIDWIVELTRIEACQVILVLDRSVQEGWIERIDASVYVFSNQRKKKEFRNFLPTKDRYILKYRMVNLLLLELPHNTEKAFLLAPYLMQMTNDVAKCRYLLMAGDLHIRNHCNKEALQCYTKVIHDLRDQYGDEEDSLFIQTSLKYLKISTASHDTKEVLSVIDDAMIRARVREDLASQALLKMHLAKNKWLLSQHNKAIKDFEQGWAITKELNNPKLLRSAYIFRCFFLYWQGRYKEAVMTYEKFLPEVEAHPRTSFPLLARLVIGRCYAYLGQISQGLGMLDAVRTDCSERGNFYFGSNAEFCIGSILLVTGRIDEALKFLENSMEKAVRFHHDWVRIMGRLALAYAYYRKDRSNRCSAYLQQFLKESVRVNVIVQPNPFLMELCWAIEQGKLPFIPDLSIEKEVSRMIRSKNILMKGVAYRYQAMIKRRKGLSEEKIFRMLNLSRKWIMESGHQIELSRSNLELARQHILIGDDKMGMTLIDESRKILASLKQSMLPSDLKPVIENSAWQDDTISQILKLGHNAIGFRNNQDLVQYILSTINQITGAERGAIFMLENDDGKSEFRLAFSRNLTADQIKNPEFTPSMRIINEVASKGKGMISRPHSPSSVKGSSGKAIRSCICTPLFLRNEVAGVIYHDNRLLDQEFEERDLEIHAYFAALAAFAMANSKAYDSVREMNKRLKQEKSYYEEQHLRMNELKEVIGGSPLFKLVLQKMSQVAMTDTTVMIQGETGVGKEVVARGIHRISRRKDQAFIQINCSTIPDSLIPSELFGHERGAFTGAINRHVGRFEMANGGTLFLDEIGELPLAVQVRLLRVLQSKEFERVGGNRTLFSDFRLIVATNRDLEKEVKAERFRSDLFYRLNVFPIQVPPLRARQEDIPLLAEHFLKIDSKKLGKKFYPISEGEINKLVSYSWPGNIRELENIIERGAILSNSPYFTVPLPELHNGQIDLSTDEHNTNTNVVSLAENEKHHIQMALNQTNWKVRGPGGAAEVLQIHPSTLFFRMKKLGIPRSGERGRPKVHKFRFQTQQK